MKFDIKAATMEESMMRFYDYFQTLMAKNIPKIKVSARDQWRPPMDQQLKMLIKEKNKKARICSEMKARGNKFEQVKSRADYNKVRNKVRWHTRKKRKQFETEIAKQAKKNTKVVWGYIKSKIKSSRDVGNIHEDPSDTKSVLLGKDIEKAEVFSKYFISVQTTEPDGEAPMVEKKKTNYDMPLLEISETTVKKHLDKLNVNKSSGPDGVSPRTLKPISQGLAKPLQLLFQKSLDVGWVVLLWKKAWISVIFKTGVRSLAENYRPISLTCILCKTMERILRDHIVDHMLRNGFFSIYQFGFIKGRSAVLQLLCALESWIEAIDNGNSVHIIYADLRKAFDKVPHKRFFEKCRFYGFSEQIMRWLENFLAGRKQNVMLNGVPS